MAYGKHYIISFKSFRGGTDYQLCIWEDGYSGSAVPLTGAAVPFETQEDDDEDAFAPVRTQFGNISIVDTGVVSWRDIMPANDLEKPVTLEVMGTPVWVGYLQSESYGGTLWGNPQERDLPVQCPLSVLQAIQVKTDETELRNFAYILKYMLDSMPSYTNSDSDPVVNRVIVQGGNYARQWLMNKVDWQNFINQDDDDGDTAKFNLYEILEDICRFWGWTARIMQRTLYLTRMDDTRNSDLLTLTYAQLTTLATGTSAGSISSQSSAQTLTDSDVVSTDNDDYQLRGPSKATVKADCNQEDTVIKFAPKVVRDELGDTWTWNGDEDNKLIGYFTTPIVKSFGQSSSSKAYNVMRGLASTYPAKAGFCRRQIFSSAQTDKGTDVDVIMLDGVPVAAGSTPMVQLSFERWRNYGGGSLSLKGSVWREWETFSTDAEVYCIFVQIGIGETRSTARWYSLRHSQTGPGTIASQWQDTPDLVALPIQGGSQLQGFTAVNITGQSSNLLSYSTWGQFNSIPIPDGLTGKLFIDFMGAGTPFFGIQDFEIQIGNFEVDFSRDVTYIPTHTESEQRERVKTEDRESSREYTSESNGQTHEEWNADCIYASDNNMDYGYGLLVKPDGSWMDKAPYYGGDEYPEQQLADRVTTYWTQSKRRMTMQITQSAASIVSPVRRVIADGTTFQPVSISHSWRDDVATIALMEL